MPRLILIGLTLGVLVIALSAQTPSLPDQNIYVYGQPMPLDKLKYADPINKEAVMWERDKGIRELDRLHQAEQRRYEQIVSGELRASNGDTTPRPTGVIISRIRDVCFFQWPTQIIAVSVQPEATCQ